MKNTNRMNVSSIALYPVNPVIPYLIINSPFYDFMDVTNVAYFNQEGHFYNPNEFNTVAYVLKYHETVVDVLGEPHSQDQLFPQGGTFVCKQGISCGSPIFNQQGERIAYPKGTYQYVGRHTP
ncbi:RTX toxin [Paenibacillus polymyxa]|nr:RTX toxin [Paenibacillus polymyxa]URJ48661.3 RTX toxin [Paenibacillus polymyxa]